VVVTRPRAQAGGLADLLEEQGAEVIPFRTIAIASPPEPAALARAVDAAAEYDRTVFTSANGVRAFFDRLTAGERDPPEPAPVRNFGALLGEAGLKRLVRGGRPVVACIGPVTAATARECGLPVTVVPRTYTAAALAAALVDHFRQAPAGER